MKFKISKWLLFAIYLIPPIHELGHALICFLFNVEINYIGFDVTRYSYTITPPDLFFALHTLNEVITVLFVVPVFYGVVKTLIMNGKLKKKE